jgi:hypothetical protein
MKKFALCLVSAAAISALWVASSTAAEGDGQAHPFTSLQPELFGEAGSISNAWADFDRDGDLDFAVSLKSGAIRLYRNDGGSFVSIGEEMGLPTSGGEIRALDWGDFDGDGWVDLFAGSSLRDKPSVLFRNLEGKRFEDVADAAGLTVPGRASRQNNWIDFDRDGDLDMYATDRAGANRLYRNDGGTFAQILADAPPTVTKSTVGACWLDYDEDGDLDLFLANQSGQTDSLFRNDGGSFTDVAPELGMDMSGRSRQEGGVGCAVGDYDNDGHLDIFVPNYGRNVLWRNNGNGGFTNTAAAMGVDVENHAVGASWGDYDNDGFIDLFVTSYHGDAPNQVPADALFHNEGGKKFVNVIAANPVINSGDHGVEWVDYDGDGAIDLSMTHGYSSVGGHFLFRNAMAPADAQRSLHVALFDAKGNAVPGAEVRLYDREGKVLATRQISTGGGYNAQSVTPAHFGLSSMAPVTVEATFLTAAGRQTQRIANVRPADFVGKVLCIDETGKRECSSGAREARN